MLQNLMYLPINFLGYPHIKKLQRDNLLHAYNMPIDIIQCSVSNLITKKCSTKILCYYLKVFPFLHQKRMETQLFLQYQIIQFTKITLYKAKILWSKLSHDTKLQHSLCNIAFGFGGLHLAFERMKTLLQNYLHKYGPLKRVDKVIVVKKRPKGN